MNRVVVLAPDGVYPFELGMPDRILGGAGYSVVTCSVDGGPVRTSADFTVNVPHGPAVLETADSVMIPAFDSALIAPRLTPALAAALARIRPGTRLMSICTGAFVLAAAGLLDGQRATTHWAHTEALAARYPEVLVDPDVLYVDGGSVLTSAGKAAAMDLCLHLVRADHGASVANTVARRLVVPPHRAGGQAQFVTSPVPARDGHSLGELFPWVAARLDHPLTVEDLARQANMSSRNLGRHFRSVTGTTPLQWLLTQRIRRAQELLETTNDSVEAIAAAAGMGTATTLRRHFNRTVGVPPDAYRRTFRS
jgi:transcriptional regulator GlxA family with amidase domain